MRYFFLFFIFFLFLSCPPGQQITQQIDKLNTEIKELREKIDILSATFDSLKITYEEHYKQFHLKKPTPPTPRRPAPPKVRPPTRK